MPAQFTPEFVFAGQSLATRGAMFKAAMKLAGITFYDEFADNAYLLSYVEALTLPGSPTIYLRWQLSEGNVGGLTLFQGWNPVTHTGTGQFAVTGGVNATFGSMRLFWSPGQYRFLLHTQIGSSTGGIATGWFRPTSQPATWPATTRPFVALSPSLVPSLSTSVVTGGAVTNAPMASYGVLDAALLGSIGKFPPFVGPTWDLHDYPDDFQVISGRSNTDFPSARETEYNVSVGGGVQTYRLLNNLNGAAYCIRVG